MAKLSSEGLKEYASAGAVAEEVFSSIRTVVAFSGQQKETDRYFRYLYFRNFVIAERLSARHIIVTLFSLSVYIYIYKCVTLRNAPRDPENH